MIFFRQILINSKKRFCTGTQLGKVGGFFSPWNNIFADKELNFGWKNQQNVWANIPTGHLNFRSLPLIELASSRSNFKAPFFAISFIIDIFYRLQPVVSFVCVFLFYSFLVPFKALKLSFFSRLRQHYPQQCIFMI